MQGEPMLPDHPNWTWHEYGMRVGVWRLKRMLERLDVSPTVTLNGRVCETYPQVVEACIANGWELNAHGYEQIPMHRSTTEKAPRPSLPARAGFHHRDWFLRDTPGFARVLMPAAARFVSSRSRSRHSRHSRSRHSRSRHSRSRRRSTCGDRQGATQLDANHSGAIRSPATQLDANHSDAIRSPATQLGASPLLSNPRPDIRRAIRSPARQPAARGQAPSPPCARQPRPAASSRRQNTLSRRQLQQSRQRQTKSISCYLLLHQLIDRFDQLARIEATWKSDMCRRG
jgi:hypothetical protein